MSPLSFGRVLLEVFPHSCATLRMDTFHRPVRLKVAEMKEVEEGKKIFAETKKMKMRTRKKGKKEKGTKGEEKKEKKEKEKEKHLSFALQQSLKEVSLFHLVL